MAFVATDDICAQSRCEVSALGAVASGRHNEPEKLGMVYVSEIIDNTCVFCCEQMNDMKGSLGPLSNYSNILLVRLWPHFRTVNLLHTVAQSGLTQLQLLIFVVS